MKTTIKTVQPYKLYKKFVNAKKDVKQKLLFGICLLLFLIAIKHDYFLALLFFTIIAAYSPMMVYNPQLKPVYEPGVSYSWVKDYVNAKAPQIFIKTIVLSGIIGGLIFDLIEGVFPVGILVSTIIFSLVALALYKYPNKMLYWKSSRLRMINHQDVDYNVKVDLNDIYGINDKMTLSYQNFHFDQKHLEKGDYLLGVSPLGIYFAHKSDSVNKTFIKFDDIDTLGLLAAIQNTFIFNIKSKSNIEINIIIDEDDSLLVSPYKLFETLLDTLDAYILNNGVAATPTTRRRRITVLSSSTDSIIDKTEELVTDTGRSIDFDTTALESTDKQSTKSNRVVDISFTKTVMAELAAGELIKSNRQIEI